MPAPFQKREPSSKSGETWYDQTSVYLHNVRWNRFFARLKYLAWEIFTKLVLGLIYFSIISEGFRILIPILAERIHRFPGLGWMNDSEALYQIDLAHLMSLFMLIAVWYLWDRILTLWLDAEITFDDLSWNQDNDITFILLLGAVVLGADACLFYLSVSNVSWGGSSFSITAVIATAAYLAVLLFVTYVSIRLRKSLHHFKKEIYRA